MRLGQKSAVHFASQFLASIAGFVATLYIARELGSDVLGTYALFTAVLIWLKTVVGSGVQQAIKKRVSEVDGSGRDLGAGLVIETGAFAVVSAGLLAFREETNDYLQFEATLLLVVSLAVVLAFSLVRAALHGEEKVHLAAVLRPLDRVVRSSVQLAVVFLGLLGGGVAGLIWGYVAGAAVAVAGGIVLVSMRPRVPRRRHFRRVLRFTRYSWLSGIEERAFSAMDTVILGLFVSQSLIGYYEVAWNLASLMAIFGVSVAQSLFPTLSGLDSEQADEVVADLINDGLAYVGLFLLPGVVGAALVGEYVLAIYGSEFREASGVLVILVLARLVYAYESQFISSLNALDYPGIAFRVNLVFVVANLVLNFALVSLFGWLGAAVGTGVAAFLGLVLAYRALSEIIAFDIPVAEIANQVTAALMMGAVVAVAELALTNGRSASIVETFLLVGLGAGIYFGALIGLSERFRMTVRDNLGIH